MGPEIGAAFSTFTTQPPGSQIASEGAYRDQIEKTSLQLPDVEVWR